MYAGGKNGGGINGVSFEMCVFVCLNGSVEKSQTHLNLPHNNRLSSMQMDTHVTTIPQL